MAIADRDKQIADAEALLADGKKEPGFATGFYFGQYRAARLAPYPDFSADPEGDQMLDALRAFCRQSIDPAKIDRDAALPDQVIRGLGEIGVLGACLPRSSGGRGLTQTQYCRIIEVLGGHCGSTALFVNAHHSIGPRAIVLFGTPEQQQKWLPKLATGEWLSAFALTEAEAGSDAANVQTTATPTPDGSAYILRGEKRYITNGAIAKVLTVMARTPVPGRSDSQITAFLVTPDMPGFEVIEARMPKLGVRGTVTSRLALREVRVPRENILGPLGKGLKVALTVLDYGRTTFGASCTGAAKFCLERARQHARSRVQFGKPIGEFELVKEKLAYIAASTFAMEAATYQTAALIDSGASDYMLETAMLKVFSTEVLWNILDHTFQIHGGMAYFTDQPFERMIRDARINTVGEGANDVLRVFIALVGMREVGLELQGIEKALSQPLSHLGRLGGFAARQLGALFSAPDVPVRSALLEEDAARLGRLIASLGRSVQKLLARYREDVLDRQYQLSRIADAATELYVGSCVLARLDQLQRLRTIDDRQRQHALAVGRYYLKTSATRIQGNLATLENDEDEHATRLADRILNGSAD